MATVTESSGDDSYSRSVLQGLKAMDLINQLEIADGLKQLLSSKDFTLKSLLNTSVSDLAETLGIDGYIARIVSSAIKEAMAAKSHNHNRMIKQSLANYCSGNRTR
jgi:hypothetical protein